MAVKNYIGSYADNKGWGELFGLNISNFTDNQLHEIGIDKLIEFIEVDPRVEKIIGDRLLLEKINNLRHVSILNKYKNPENFGYLLQQYNSELRNRRNEINELDRYISSAFFNWNLLDWDNKHHEIDQWCQGKPSVYTTGQLKVSYIYLNFPDLVHDFTPQVISKATTGYYNGRGNVQGELSDIIDDLTREDLLKYIDTIFNDCNVYTQIYTLGRDDVPFGYRVKAIRLLSKYETKFRLSGCVDKKLLKTLPTVARLNTLEKLFFHHYYVTFEDMNYSDFEELLFSAAVKYHDRVGRLLERVSWKFKQEQNDE